MEIGDQYQNIERYLSGDLSVSEKEIFEKSLLSDPKLAEAVDQHQQMIERLDGVRLRKKVQENILSQTTYPKTGITALGFLVIAASITLLILTAWFLFKSENEVTPFPQENSNPSIIDSIYEKRMIPIKVDTSGNPKNNEIQDTTVKSIPSARFLTLANAFLIFPTMGINRNITEPEKNKDVFTEAMELYNKKEYQKALNIIMLKNSHNPQEEEIFLKAHIYFQLMKFDLASNHFTKLTESYQFKYEANWNYLLCQLALGKLTKVNLILDKIIADKDHPFHDKAIELKTKLNF